MTREATAQRMYTVSIHVDPGADDELRFTFVPRSAGQSRVKGEPSEPKSQFIVSVCEHADAMAFDWIKPPPRQAVREELEGVVREHVVARHEWLEKLSKLVATVKRWAEEFEWATRAVEKKMEDAEIGSYRAPALLMQQETIRLFLEPVSRDAPGTEGVVDLYLMPSYDDIASLYFYNDRWNIHYLFKGAATAGNTRDAEAKPLSKATLRKVFDQMKAHAA